MLTQNPLGIHPGAVQLYLLEAQFWLLLLYSITKTLGMVRPPALFSFPEYVFWQFYMFCLLIHLHLFMCGTVFCYNGFLVQFRIKYFDCSLCLCVLWPFRLFGALKWMLGLFFQASKNSFHKNFYRKIVLNMQMSFFLQYIRFSMLIVLIHEYSVLVVYSSGFLFVCCFL